MTYITRLGDEENIPGLDEEFLKIDIRSHYRSEYITNEKKRDPHARRSAKLFGFGGLASAAAGAALIILVPVSPLVIVGGAALLLAGAVGITTGQNGAGIYEQRAKKALDDDIDNFTLVKRFVTTVLAGRQSDIDSREKWQEQDFAVRRQQIERERKQLDRTRKAAVSLLSQGLDRFESEAKASLDEVTNLRKEAASFAAEFGGVAKKPEADSSTPAAQPGRGRIPVTSAFVYRPDGYGPSGRGW